ncbi:MAG: AMP-binding protein [Pseudomonadota bacterium]
MTDPVEGPPVTQTDRRFVAEGLSHVAGRTDVPLLEKTIPQVLAETVAAYPDHEAGVFAEQGIRWTYADFARDVDRLAGGLLRLGLRKGDRVGVWSPNRAEWFLAQFATARVGIILVCINPAYRVGELEYALNKVGCKGLITAQRFKTSDYVGMLTELAPELATAEPGALHAVRVPDLRTVICLGADVPAGMIAFDAVCSLGDAVAADEIAEIADGLSPDELVNIQFTSGTTGNPKGASLTHRNIVNNAHFVTSTIRFTAEDRLSMPVPFYHCFGMVLGVLGCVTKGATLVCAGEAFDPDQLLKVTAEERCTALYGVPTMFVGMLEAATFASHDLTSLRTGIMAGAPCPIEVMRRVQTDMHMSEMTIAYGMTETSPVSFQCDVDDPVEKRVSTVGRILPHVECKVVDETGATVPVGVQGELLTRGYVVMDGYWDDAEKTAEAVVDGWMHTGDIATIDAEGYCDITGRVKDMVLRGGENIYPREVEDFLFTHPDIAQAQVFGIPDPKYGELVCAWIVVREGRSLDEAAVRAYCKDRIAHFKVPTHVRIKTELPMTVTGKPQKFVMRDAMVAELEAATV